MENATIYSDPSICMAEELSENHGLVLLDILSYLKSKLTVESLYLLGTHCSSYSSKSLMFTENCKHKKHYQLDLMVIGKKIPPNAVADLSSCIKTFTKGLYNVTLLFHKPSEVKDSKSPQQYFFNEVREKGWWLAGYNNLQILKPVEPLSPPDLRSVQRFCKDRCEAAKHLLAIECHLDSNRVSLLEVSLLHQVVEQLCIALIYKFMHYYPNHFHLGYLLDICKSFTDIGEEVFPRQSKEDQELFRILSRPVHDSRYRRLNPYEIYQVEILANRSVVFYGKVRALVLE